MSDYLSDAVGKQKSNYATAPLGAGWRTGPLAYYAKTATTEPKIAYQKRVNGHVLVVEEVRSPKKRTLMLVSMRKRPATSDVPDMFAGTPSYTAEPVRGAAPENLPDAQRSVSFDEPRRDESGASAPRGEVVWDRGGSAMDAATMPVELHTPRETPPPAQNACHSVSSARAKGRLTRRSLPDP